MEEKKHKPRFKVGDLLTYKDEDTLMLNYHHGGDNQSGFIGTVKKIKEYDTYKNCFALMVTAKEDYEYKMLENEFEEWGTPLEPTRDEILKKANKDYPVGTIIKSMFSEKIDEILNTMFTWEDTNLYYISKYTNTYLYYEGKWAEIITKPAIATIEEATLFNDDIDYVESAWKTSKVVGYTDELPFKVERNQKQVPVI